MRIETANLTLDFDPLDNIQRELADKLLDFLVFGVTPPTKSIIKSVREFLEAADSPASYAEIAKHISLTPAQVRNCVNSHRRSFQRSVHDGETTVALKSNLNPTASP